MLEWLDCQHHNWLCWRGLGPHSTLLIIREEKWRVLEIRSSVLPSLQLSCSGLGCSPRCWNWPSLIGQNITTLLHLHSALASSCPVPAKTATDNRVGQPKTTKAASNILQGFVCKYSAPEQLRYDLPGWARFEYLQDSRETSGLIKKYLIRLLLLGLSRKLRPRFPGRNRKKT